MTTTPPAPPERKPYISPPPSKEDVDLVSGEQALIADEWAPEPGAADASTTGTGAKPDVPT